jgi:hypothetical protein
MLSKPKDPQIDSRTARLIVGLIALPLPRSPSCSPAAISSQSAPHTTREAGPKPF